MLGRPQGTHCKSGCGLTPWYLKHENYYYVQMCPWISLTLMGIVIICLMARLCYIWQPEFVGCFHTCAFRWLVPHVCVSLTGSMCVRFVSWFHNPHVCVSLAGSMCVRFIGWFHVCAFYWLVPQSTCVRLVGWFLMCAFRWLVPQSTWSYLLIYAK